MSTHGVAYEQPDGRDPQRARAERAWPSIDPLRPAADEPDLAEARRHLRHGDAALALAALDRCAEALGDDPDYRERRTYTLLRLGRDGPAQPPRLPPAGHERVVRWLTREELAAAERALREQRYTAALQACDAAWRIDHRGTRCALLRATGLYRRVREATTRTPPHDLRMMRAHLVEAGRWVRTARDDPTLRAECEPVAAAIDRLLSTVDEALAREELAEQLQQLIKRYNALMGIYRPSMMTMVALGNLRSSLAAMGTEVALLARRIPPDSPAGTRLAELDQQIKRMQALFR